MNSYDHHTKRDWRRPAHNQENIYLLVAVILLLIFLAWSVLWLLSSVLAPVTPDAPPPATDTFHR